MKPETEAYLAKAAQCLVYGRKNLSLDLGDDAGRNAYLATFHAAQAYLFEETGKVTKTHTGLRSEFARIAKETASIPRPYLAFLAQVYSLKEIADYEFGPDSTIPTSRAKEALDTAESFVALIRDLIRKGT